ncbi:hypothetical protein BDZ89DRAFT_694473 [Hymenopellis radicata]|nr:hypothetical protein BDZ89DRAFT_694473 [Hymenopellis radicata]
MLAALFCSQIIHELGHAVSGALESIPIQSAGAALTLVIPSAFVAFPTSYIDALKPLARARVIAAGPCTMQSAGSFFLFLAGCS